MGILTALVAVLLGGAGLVAGVRWLERRHARELERAYGDMARQLGVPVEWTGTLLEIRGLPDGKRSLVYDWGIERWVEE